MNPASDMSVCATFHTKNAKNGMLHGIEVANTHSYSEGAFQAALDFNLALIGTSDVHDLIDWDYEPHNGGHRPVTLVFAEEKTTESIKEALFARRTVVWFKNMLIGRQADLHHGATHFRGHLLGGADLRYGLVR